MSHGVKLFPTVPNYPFIGSNDGWTAESGVSINANATTIAAQTALRIISSGQTVGAQSPLLTLAGSETPVRVDVLYKTADSSQTANVTLLNQAGTVIGSTVFATSAYSTTYNDYRRAVLDVTAPSGTTGVRCRICRGNAISGEISVESVGLHENILLLDPDTIQRNPMVARSEQLTLSGRRIVDVLHRHYAFNYAWNFLEAASYDRLQEAFYRNESLWLNDGDVPDNQEVVDIYTKGVIDHTNIQSLYGTAANALRAWTVVDSLLPNDTGFGSDATSWAAAAITNLSTSAGASITTSLNSAYTYARFMLPTDISSIGNYDHAMTLSVDILTEIKSTAAGPYGFDVWIRDATQALWRKVRSVVRTGEMHTVLDMRSTDMVGQFTNANTTAQVAEFLFRARSTNRVPGATLTFKNLRWLGNHGFDPRLTAAQTIAPLGFGGYVVETQDQYTSIVTVALDSRRSLVVNDGLTSLDLGQERTDYANGIIAVVPASNLSAGRANGGSVLIRYQRDFRVVLDAMPEQFFHTGDLTDHTRQVSLQMHTVRSSVFDTLEGNL